MIGKKSKNGINKRKYMPNPINIICLAYLGIPEEMKHLNIIIILLVIVIFIQKLKK